MEWQPIDTFNDGPEYEDGVIITDASRPFPAVGVARIIGGEWIGYDHEMGVECVYPSPTHWMPLPEPPK